MAKRKQENEELLKNSYYMADKELQLTGKSPVQQVHELVDAADKVLTEICQGADTIKIHTYNEIKEEYENLGMPKAVWLELVNLRRLKLFTSIPEKVLERINQSYQGMRNVAALRETLVGDIIDDKPLKVSSVESQKALEYERDFELDDEFMTKLNNCAHIRNHLDTVLWPKLKVYGEAFCFLTKEPYNNFKFLLDMQHYKGGWPSEKTPPRIWRAIAGFRYVYETMERWGYEAHKDWAKRFGLEVTLKSQHPSRLNYSELAKKFGKYTMYAILPKYQQEYALKYGIKPWHHLIEIPEINACLAYIWDTRIIELALPNFTVPEQHRNNDIIDSCEKLVPSTQELRELVSNLDNDIIFKLDDK